MRRFVILIFFTVLITSIGGWFAVSAQTWLMSPSPPPDNTTIRPISGGSGDNLGLTDPHTATEALHLSATTNPGFRLYGIGGTFAQGALQVASDKIGVSLGAVNNFALKAVSTANDASFAGLYAEQTEGYPALVASSAANISAQLFGLTYVSTGLIMGNNPANILSLTAQTADAENKLYWGNRLLCNPKLPNCGWIVSGASGDGLGNHIATQTLNMNGKSIYNIGSASANSSDAAIVAVGTLASTTIDSSSTGFHGIFAESLSADSATAGLYATSTGSGPALYGTSVSGRGGRSSGPLELLNYSLGAVNVPLQIQLGPAGNDRLNVAALAGAPTSNLYWGDKLLCDVSDINKPCGWAQGSGTPGFWLDNPKGIHYPADPAGADATKGVLIGRAVDATVATKLDIGHSYLAGEPSSRYNLAALPLGSAAQDVVLGGSRAYVATANGLVIVDVTRPILPVVLGSVSGLGSVWGLVVSGRYAYLATSAGLKVIDIIDSRNPILKGSLAIANISSVPYATDIKVSGHYAFVSYDLTSNTGGLQVIDITDPNLPILKKTVVTNIIDPRNIAINGNDLALVDEFTGLKVYHISDLITQANPAPYISTLATLSGVAIRGNYIFGVGDTLYIFDRANGAEVGRYGDDFQAYGIQAADDYVYVLGDKLRIFNTDNVGLISEVANNNPYTASGMGRLAVAGRFIYLADRSAQFSVKNNQGLQASVAFANSGTFDAMSVLSNMGIGGNITAQSLVVGTLGMNVNGTISLSSSGLQLQDVILDKTALDKLFVKCGAACP